MARKPKHEEHQNHEAWAIPYGDLVTLLLAFFVVMYAISTVNEGKYRVLSDSMNAAFRGTPRAMEPIQVGEKSMGTGADKQVTLVQHAFFQSAPREIVKLPTVQMASKMKRGGAEERQATETGESEQESAREQNAKLIAKQGLITVAEHVERAMDGLIKDKLIMVRRHDFWVEVEIRTDILFPSGSATLAPAAVHALEQLAETLAPFSNPMRVEGHTDNRPINTVAFPSNWELSAARAASVVHLLTQRGVAAHRLAVIGLGENRPAQSNDTLEGRNANRRVLIIILSDSENPEGNYPSELDKPGEAATPTPAAAAPATAKLEPAEAPNAIAQAVADGR